MILGIFLKGYKTYQNLTFIPFIQEPSHKLSIFIGKNGAGKSSILEALDTLFNNREWNTNINSKKGEGFICPIFLISKREKTLSKAIPYISDYFWNYTTPLNVGAAAYDAWVQFIDFREELKTYISPSDFYLVVTGIDEEGQQSYTSTHKKIRDSFRRNSISFNDHEKTKQSILDQYRYIYLPIHNSPTSLLDLKAKELQALLDKNFTKEIEKILSTETDRSNPVRKINDHLEKFVDEINTKLHDLNGEYQYKSNQTHRITPQDISEIIINKYLTKRPLQKESKSIENLSSGEQRMAIIDVAYAFLSKSTDTTKEIILAIDEPEASLSPTNCLTQFRRIFEISSKFKKQSLISTHWYGLLMAPEDATLTHIEKSENRPYFNSFNLAKIQEERRKFPDSFEMKSYFDLISSILSVIKGGENNWIICEGQDDKNYIKKLVSPDIKNLTILPIGGRGGVIKTYAYLRIAAEDKAERGLLKGKILCLIDSDPEIISIETGNRESKKHLKILRFQIDQKGEAQLVEPSDSGHYKETELEDTLNPIDYYNAASAAIRRKGTPELKKVFSENLPAKEATYAGINYNLKFLQRTSLQAYEETDNIKEFLTKNEIKALLSELYTPINSKPSWTETIDSFFLNQQNQKDN